MTEDILHIVRKDNNWEGNIVVVPRPEDAVTTHMERHLSIYRYPFTLGSMDPIVLEFYKRYEVRLRQIQPSLWRIVTLIRYFVNKTESLMFTMDHLLRLYSP